MRNGGPIVAVDGPAGSGKSSTSKEVARALGLRYLDTGALYRAITWWMLHNGIDLDDSEAVGQAAQGARISISCEPEDVIVRVDERDVSSQIRSPEVASAVSVVSAVPKVRERLVQMQRALIADGGIVVEGRDIGTVVAPEADVKVFVTASPEVRARRRNQDFGRGSDCIDETLQSLQRRDEMDSSRDHSPLSRADDAVEIDTSHLSLAEVVQRICTLVHALDGADDR